MNADASSENVDRQSTIWVSGGIILLTFLAPFLGGSTELWAQAAISLGAGLLLLFFPPRKSLGLVPNVCLAGFVLLGLAAFVPAKMFATEDWRSALIGFGISLPVTHTPQPWITLQSVLLLILILAWAYYLFAQEQWRTMREKAWVAYAIGGLILATLLIVCFLSKQRVPLWPNVPEFGFFPNRNQTSNVLGICGIAIYALGLQRFQENRKHWWLWFVSLTLICWALILNYSRAGIVLFFFGALAVHVYWWTRLKERRRRTIALGGLVLLIAIFLINGGATLARFGPETARFFSPTENLRLAIYRDAFDLLIRSPVLGVGLGNFHRIFSMHRYYSTGQSESIHPESDWLWSAIEMGWIAPLLMLLLLWWWLKQCTPFGPGTFRIMRVAAMVGACAFAVHGLFDVSGHRIGALWPALLLASSAIHPQRSFEPASYIAPIFRALGVLLIAVALWWFGSIWGVSVPPTTATLQRLEQKMEAATLQDDYSQVLQLASKGLQVAPLDWSLYYKRATAEAVLFNFRADAARDFAVARYLLPFWPELCFKEGTVWLAVGETDRAFDAWAEALRRSPQKAPGLYTQMFSLIKSDAAAVDRWRELAHTNKQFLFIFLQNARPVEFEIELDRLLSDDQQFQSLTPNELSMLFSIWYEKGDKLELAENLRERPDWQKIGWRLFARVCADYQDYRQAYETVLKFDPPPVLPATNSDQSLEKLAARFQVNQTDVGNGLALYRAQIKEGRKDAALVTLRRLSRVEGSPKYLSYLEAQLWAQNGQWKEAWEAAARFEFGGR